MDCGICPLYELAVVFDLIFLTTIKLNGIKELNFKLRGFSVCVCRYESECSHDMWMLVYLHTDGRIIFFLNLYHIYGVRLCSFRQWGWGAILNEMVIVVLI